MIQTIGLIVAIYSVATLVPLVLRPADSATIRTAIRVIALLAIVAIGALATTLIWQQYHLDLGTPPW